MSATCPDSSKLPFSCQCFDFIGSGVEIEIACSGASVEELIEALQFIDSSARLQVQLNSMSLQTLPSRIFAEWNLVKLEIAECDLVSLVEQGEVALSGLENTLEVSMGLRKSFLNKTSIVIDNLSYRNDHFLQLYLATNAFIHS
ncbi:hypothetical protein HNY73_001085 [Argiope bruennichi]|uniref:Uncharacterized protein n=1 Tax=Argiope bruennichi TaxID=94029 RepID=A0A8T0G194_ARGBR|nr:hypothetical protein HNY73_001085 [Argiope bruennichi]